MKIRTLLAGLGALTVGGAASAALTLNVTSTAGDHLFIRSPDVGSPNSSYNSVPAGATANIYWDANQNGVFGEVGENSGNGATLAFSTAIVSGQEIHFGMEGFDNADDTGFIEFTLILDDSSTLRQTVHEGTTEAFSDSNGDQWEATFDFVNEGYGNVVDNITHTGGGDGTLDHQGILTLTQVPEPGSLALLGLGGLMLVRRRRA